MSRWYDRAVEQLEQELKNGSISDEEFRKHMRDLNEELRDEAHKNAERAYRDTIGDW